VILDDNVSFVPNVGIIVGDRSTLIVDTGMGISNGRAILNEARKLDADNNLFVVSTHFHPEHAMGEAGFPDDATIVRSQAQQDDIEEFGTDTAERFKTFVTFNADLLEGLEFRDADRIFETEMTLDLGGVQARVFWLGPTHTRGDTMVFVDGDDVLFAGDVVMNQRFVSFNSTYSSLDAWLDSLDELETLGTTQIIPSHGAIGDQSLIETNREYLAAIRWRVVRLKAGGRLIDEASETAASEVHPRFPGWSGSLTNAVRVAYDEAD
jgi:glyoxylase-like metal-dependent hydrolase (beta-lactamase superfamily II)